MTPESRSPERRPARPPQTELSGGAADNHCCDPFDFRMPFSSTPLGARLARLLTLHQLDEWQIPYGSGLSDDAAAVVAELAANAVRHGHLTGQDFRLRLALSPAPGTARTLRIEVADPRPPMRRLSRPAQSPVDEESGRGLLLVAALTTCWGVRADGPLRCGGKTVWAELDRP